MKSGFNDLAGEETRLVWVEEWIISKETDSEVNKGIMQIEKCEWLLGRGWREDNFF